MFQRLLTRKYITTSNFTDKEIANLVEEHGFYSIRSSSGQNGRVYHFKMRPSLLNYFRGATSQVVRVTGIEEEENLALKIEVHPILILAFLFYAFIALFICVEAYQNTDYALMASFFMSIFIVLSILLVFIFFEMKYTEQRLREIFISIEAA